MSVLQPDPRKTQLIGLLVAVVGGGGIIGMYAFATGDPWRGEQTMITAHFGSVSGLKKGSDVLLSGKNVGHVDNVAFVTSKYECNPATEDLGRDATDSCEPSLFCATQPEGDGLCAELWPFTGVADDYADKGCLVDQQCKTTEVCVNPQFRRRSPDIAWYGPENTCIPYEVDHQRMEVRMAIQADKLSFISRDSKASVASKGPLGDQQINIDSGTGPSIEAGGHIQSAPTLLEELNQFRERIGAVTKRFSGHLDGIRGLRGSIRSGEDQPHTDMRTNLARVGEATGDIVDQQGQLGELFKDGARDEFIASLGDLRSSSDETARDLINWRRENSPKLRRLSDGLGQFAGSAAAAANPDDEGMGSKLLTDERFGLDIADRVSKVTETLSDTRNKLGDAQKSVVELRDDVEAGEGTLGELLRDPGLYYRFVKAISMFDMLDRNDGFKALVRTVTAAADEYDAADPARDRAKRRPTPAQE